MFSQRHAGVRLQKSHHAKNAGRKIGSACRCWDQCSQLSCRLGFDLDAEEIIGTSVLARRGKRTASLSVVRSSRGHGERSDDEAVPFRLGVAVMVVSA